MNATDPLWFNPRPIAILLGFSKTTARAIESVLLRLGCQSDRCSPIHVHHGDPVRHPIHRPAPINPPISPPDSPIILDGGSGQG
jgi:hypothetical protein